MAIKFNRNWFNPLYFILNDILKDSSIRTVLIYGGKSSSKTVSVTQLLAKEAAVKHASTIAFRKESTTIKTTLKKSFDLAIKSMYLQPAFEPLELSYRGKNSEIVLKGLDDEEKAKGVESYKYVYLDELNHFSEGEFTQFELSLRGIEGQKILASWNPVDESSWVKTELVDSYEWETHPDYKLPCDNSFVKVSTNGKAILIKTTYEDNYFISGSPDGSYGYRDENLIAVYKALRVKNYNSYKVNVLGEWGKVEFGGEFLKSWDTSKHTGLHPYDPKQAIYLSFDENVNPYFPVGFFQVGRDQKSPRMIHCIAAKNPNNTVRWLCQEIDRVLTKWGHKELVFVGGDATSKKQDVKIEKGHDLFKLIMDNLAKWHPRRHVASSNPSVRMSASFFNSLLSGDVEDMSFGVSEKCRVAIADYENTKEDKNGGVDKSTVQDPKTKVRYQPFGHFVDLTRYFLVHTFRTEYGAYQKGDADAFMATSTGTELFNNRKRY